MYRGQVASYDILMSFVGFILIFSFVLFLWNQNFTKAFGQQEIIQKQLKANQALDVLIKSKGYPLNWETNPGNVEVIGLASKENVLSQKKVDAFSKLAYDNAREKLKLGPYDFQFDLNTGNPADNKSIGISPPSTEAVIVLQRAVIYKGVDSNVFFKLFKT